jgi:hypothetical protein
MAVMPFGTHPVMACAQQIASELRDVASVPVELMSSADKAAALVEVTRAANQLDALRLRLLAASDDVALDAGSRDAAAWLAHETAPIAASSTATSSSPRHWPSAGTGSATVSRTER